MPVQPPAKAGAGARARNRLDRHSGAHKCHKSDARQKEAAVTQEETRLHFAAPTPGDIYTEMYAFWLVVVRVGPRSLTAFTFSGSPASPQLSEWREYADNAAFQAAFRYPTRSAFWMQYADNWGADSIGRLATFAASWPKNMGDWYPGPAWNAKATG